MPVLKYLADTNAISDLFRGDAAVNRWFEEHDGQIAISTITLAEIRRGIELRPEGKIRRELEREYRFILEDFQGAIFASTNRRQSNGGSSWPSNAINCLPTTIHSLAQSPVLMIWLSRHGTIKISRA